MVVVGGDHDDHGETHRLLLLHLLLPSLSMMDMFIG
jgi:hypothetical protein